MAKAFSGNVLLSFVSLSIVNVFPFRHCSMWLGYGISAAVLFWATDIVAIVRAIAMVVNICFILLVFLDMGLFNTFCLFLYVESVECLLVSLGVCIVFAECLCKVVCA